MWCSVWIMQNLYFHYDLCTGHFIDFVLFLGFFLFIATVYVFADCNNELLVKKKIHFVNNKNNVHVLF